MSPDFGSFLSTVSDEAVDYVDAGMSVDLVGHRGSGRTTVLNAIVSVLSERHWEVVRVRGISALHERPLEALAIDGLARRADPRGRSAVSSSVDLVERAIEGERGVLVVDDFDDLDLASSGVMAAASVRRRIPLLTTTRPRPDRVRRQLVSLSAERPGVQLTMPPLEYIQVHALINESLPGTIDGDLVARIHDASGGLPGLVVAMVLTARNSGRLRLVDGVWTAGADLWSPGLSQVLRSLTADLDPTGVEALHTLSMAGPLALRKAVELVGWDALEDLDGSRLLTFATHRDSVAVGVYPRLLADLHRHLPLGARRLRFLDQLDARLDTPVVVDPGGTSPSWSLNANSFPGSIRNWPAERPEVPGAVLDSLMRDVSRRQRLVRRREWEQEPSPWTAVPYLRSLLVDDAGEDELRDAIESTPLSGTHAEQAMFRGWQAAALAFGIGDLDAARASLDRGLENSGGDSSAESRFLETIKDHITLVFERVPPFREDAGVAASRWPIVKDAADAVQAEVLIAAGRPREALTLLDERRWANVDFDLTTARDVLLGLARLVDGDPRSALAWSRHHLEQARGDLDTDSIPGHAYVAASALALLGQADALRTVLGSVLSGPAPALQRHFTGALITTAAVVARYDCLTTTAATLVDQACAVAPGAPPHILTIPAWAAALHDGTQGNLQATADRLWETSLTLADRGYVVSAVAHAGTALDLAPNEQRLAALRDLAEPRPSGLVQAIVRVAETSVDPDVAKAVGLCRELIDSGMVTLGVSALKNGVRHLRADGDTAKATSLLRNTRRHLQRMDVDPNSFLIRLAPRSELTSRELDVSKLVAQGLGNGEIARQLGVSPKTVENHLNHILRKLGVSDRSGIARALQEDPAISL